VICWFLNQVPLIKQFDPTLLQLLTTLGDWAAAVAPARLPAALQTEAPVRFAAVQSPLPGTPWDSRLCLGEGRSASPTALPTQEQIASSLFSSVK